MSGASWSGEGLTRQMCDRPIGGCGALAPPVDSRGPRAQRAARVAKGPARGGPRLSRGWDTERRRVRVRWWTQVPRMAIDSALAALIGRPAELPARGLMLRWPSASAGARWLERGTRGRGGTLAGSEAAVTTCARRLVSVWCACAWRRWCDAPSCATWRVEMEAAAVGCTAAGCETGVARGAGVSLTTGSPQSQLTVAALAAEAKANAPASTIEVNTARVGVVTFRSIDGPGLRCIRNGQTPEGFHVNHAGRVGCTPTHDSTRIPGCAPPSGCWSSSAYSP